jgi:predicted SprT family Zn-dependent metalloprotease
MRAIMGLPTDFAVVPLMEILQTIAHEMVHLWQFHFGTPGRRGYHNKEWAAKMESIGLMPSDTGKEGGKKLGEKMADYVIEGGQFEASANKLIESNFGITWKDRLPNREQLAHVVAGEVEGVEISELEAMGVELVAVEVNKSNRRKYTCMCAINVWGKPNLNLICGDCESKFVDSENIDTNGNKA